MSPSTSDAAVRDATGRDWAGWFSALEAAEGGEPRSHKELVAWLEAEHGETVSAWWRQMITNEYEKHTGRRELGETADAGYQLGASRTLPVAPSDIWAALVGPGGLGRWLGDVPLTLEEGSTYAASGGGANRGREDAARNAAFDTPEPPEGEVRVVVPGDRVRLTWQPGGWPRPSTLQVRLSETGPGRTRVTFHHEHLPDADAREAMRSRWKAALAELADTVTGE